MLPDKLLAKDEFYKAQSIATLLLFDVARTNQLSLNIDYDNGQYIVYIGTENFKCKADEYSLIVNAVVKRIMNKPENFRKKHPAAE